jgi:predicted ester cyclase
MSIDEQKATVRRLTDAMNAHDEATLEAVATPTVARQLKDAIQWVYATYEGHHIEVTDMIAEGDTVVVRVATQGGHSGEWEGVPATGIHWTNTGVLFVRFENGKIAQFEGLFDELGHLKQLGATITPPTPKQT